MLLLAVLAFPVAIWADSVNIDDRDPRVVYQSPGAAWTVHTNQPSNFSLYNNTDTFTSVKGATISFTFNGSSVAYWGNTGTYHGPCGITMDGVFMGNVSSNAASTGPPIQLWESAHLSADENPHTILITVVADSFPNVCELDRFVYTPSAAQGTTTGQTTKGGSNTVAIAAGAAGGVVALLLLLGLYLVFRRRSKRAALEATIAKAKPRPGHTPMAQDPAQPAFARPVTDAYTPASGYPTPPPTAPSFPVPAPAAARVSTYSDISSPPTSAKPLLAGAASHAASQRLSEYSTSTSHASPSPSPAANVTRFSSASAGPASYPGENGRRVLSAESELLAEGSSTGPGIAAAHHVQDSKATAPAQEPQRPVVQHSDAGRVEEPKPAAAEELPPAYNEGWQNQP